ncbi:MAG: aldo/keto reductase [Opitutaceae bacterium]
MPHQTLQGICPTREQGLKSAVTLNNASEMPWLGLGVFQMESDRQTAACVRFAIQNGYRSIDTASIYENERGVAEGIRTCGVPREELFITTKLWNDDMRKKREERAFEESLERLGLDYVDLYLLHWPVEGRIVEAWATLEKLQKAGRVRAIGVSNFLVPHLEEVLKAGSVVPAVNQIEFHPYLQSPELIRFCRDKGIQIEAWSPLMQAGRVLKDRVLRGIAKKHARTAPQVILRWNVQSGVVTIPKSVHEKRIIENSDIFGFELSAEEMEAIARLDRGERAGPDPANFGF